MALAHGADVNHQNKQGNTALHFAFTYDPTGQLAEFLIEKGADDTLRNAAGATPYDGV
jgi:ankyrin repeat protein